MADRDEEFTTYVTARMPWLRRVAYLLCQDWHRASRPDRDHAPLRALAELPPRQRAAVVLRFYCDLSIEQTADVLNCSTGTVKSQSARGLDALRRVLEPVAEGERPA